MSKKVLVISSSPRRGGNSDTLCDQFINGATESGHKAEKIFLKDKKINYCTGCGLCNTNDYTACSQNDDMKDILEKIIASDVIVMATPVYFYTMCGQMKTFIDRFCSRYTHITDKDFYFILTAADDNKDALERTAEEFRGLLACLDNCTEKGILYGTGIWKRGEVNSTTLPEQAFDMGKSI